MLEGKLISQKDLVYSENLNLVFVLMMMKNDLHCRFFKQYLLLFLINQMASGLFRMIGALGRTMTLAMTFGGFALLILFALGGFSLARGTRR